jgi:dienelactone hydrolase
MAAPAEQRALLRSLLGELPPAGAAIRAEPLGEELRDGYVLERWRLDLNGLEPVPAILARPPGPRQRRPAVLFNHSHGGAYHLGKRELLDGNVYLQPEPYARALTGAGYAVLAIDHWCFGERATATEQDTFKSMLWDGRVLWGMMVHDALRALDWLRSRDDVDPARVATLGMSMGSTMAQWVAALDERVKVTVDLFCLTDWHALRAAGGLSGHGLYYFVPGLLRHFTASALNALVVPRAHLAIAGLRDPLTPPEGLARIDEALRAAYAAAGVPGRWRLDRLDVAHQETPGARAAALTFLGEHL